MTDPNMEAMDRDPELIALTRSASAALRDAMLTFFARHDAAPEKLVFIAWAQGLMSHLGYIGEFLSAFLEAKPRTAEEWKVLLVKLGVAPDMVDELSEQYRREYLKRRAT